jgi:hypothetical protein
MTTVLSLGMTSMLPLLPIMGTPGNRRKIG